MACALGIFVILCSLILLLPSTAIRGNELIAFVFNKFTFSYIWLTGMFAGSLVGFFSGGWVASRPRFLNQKYIWVLIGGLTSIATFFITFVAVGLDDIVLEIAGITATICGMIGGLVARFVYSMLQRRFLPELQIN